MKILRFMTAFMLTLILLTSSVLGAILDPKVDRSSSTSNYELLVTPEEYDGVYYAQPGDTLEVEIEFSVYAGLFGSVEDDYRAEVYAQLDIDEDDEDYLKAVDNYTANFTLRGDREKTEEFNIKIDEDTPEDTYYVTLEAWTETGKLDDESINLTIIVGEYEDLDIELAQDTIYSGEDMRAELILTNEGNDDYLVELDVDSYALGPQLSDDYIRVSEDESERVYINFRKTPSPGLYTLKIDTTIYVGDDTRGERQNFQKELTLRVEDGVNSESSFYIYNSMIELSSDMSQRALFDFTNEGDRELSVSFTARVDDPSIIASVEDSFAYLGAGETIENSVYLRAGPNTEPGHKTLTIVAQTETGKAEREVTLLFEGEDILIGQADNTTAYMGSTITQNLSVSNNTGRDVELYFSIDSEDRVNLPVSNLTLYPGETKNLQVNISPVSTGYKSYTLNVNGDAYTTKEIFYSVVGEGSSAQNVEPLRITEIEETIYFNEGEETKLTFTVINPNSENIENAILKVMKNGQILSTKVFSIGGNETIELEVSALIDEDDEFIGEVVIDSGRDESSYDVKFAPNFGLFGAGLFSLGVGSTIGVIIGVIIIVLVVVLLLWNNKEDNFTKVENK